MTWANGLLFLGKKVIIPQSGKGLEIKEDFMSQAKVERYKEEKRNRKQIIAREKRQRAAGIAAACVVGAALVGWIGVSGYQAYQNSRPVETIYADLSALDDYMNGLTTE